MNFIYGTKLHGNTCQDRIDGGRGNGKISGGTGNDIVTSGDGDDTTNGDGGIVVSASTGRKTTQIVLLKDVHSVDTNQMILDGLLLL